MMLTVVTGVLRHTMNAQIHRPMFKSEPKTGTNAITAVVIKISQSGNFSTKAAGNINNNLMMSANAEKKAVINQNKVPIRLAKIFLSHFIL